MAARIAGLVLRAEYKEATAAFYRELGLNLFEHAHGGPEHFEMKPLSFDIVFELYQASQKFNQDALMLEVDSLTHTLRVCANNGIFPAAAMKVVPGMQFVYVTDMDGRLLMLMEKT